MQHILNNDGFQRHDQLCPLSADILIGIICRASGVCLTIDVLLFYWTDA